MTGTTPNNPPTSGSPQEIRDQIQITREELGETVQALAEKTDIQAQAKRRIEETKASVSEKREEMFHKVKDATPGTAAQAAGQASHVARRNPIPLAVAGGFAAGFLLGRATAD